MRITLPVELEIVQLIDSLDMEKSHRRNVVEACRRAPEPSIIITYGTDTMAETAAMIAVARLTKTVVLTGAMVPYTVAGSDSLFNLGAAVSAMQLLLPGVFIAMNGRLFSWNDVHKDRAAGRFETRSGGHP